MLRGSPRTNPPMLRALQMASSFSASTVNFLRFMVSSGVATDKKVSLTATPMVTVPKSSPAMAFICGSDVANSSKSSKIIQSLRRAGHLHALVPNQPDQRQTPPEPLPRSRVLDLCRPEYPRPRSIVPIPSPNRPRWRDDPTGVEPFRGSWPVGLRRPFRRPQRYLRRLDRQSGHLWQFIVHACPC